MLHAENSQRSGGTRTLELGCMELGCMELGCMELGCVELGCIVAETAEGRNSRAVKEHDPGVNVMMHDLAYMSGLQGSTDRSPDQQRLAEGQGLVDRQDFTKRAALMSTLHQIGATSRRQSRREWHAHGWVTTKCLDGRTFCGEQRQTFSIELADSEIDDHRPMGDIVDSQP